MKPAEEWDIPYGGLRVEPYQPCLLTQPKVPKKRTEITRQQTNFQKDIFKGYSTGEKLISTGKKQSQDERPAQSTTTGVYQVTLNCEIIP